MTLTNTPEKSTTSRSVPNTPTDVVWVTNLTVASTAVGVSVTDTAALAAGAAAAGIANERHAEQAVNAVREVLEPYDE